MTNYSNAVARRYWNLRLAPIEVAPQTTTNTNPETTTKPAVICGVDIGQSVDHSALVITTVEPRTRNVDGAEKKENHFYVKRIERFPLSTPYANVIARCKVIDDKLRADGYRRKWLVDIGGARPIVDLYRQYGMRVTPVQIKFSGRSRIEKGTAFVNKTEMASNLQILTNKDNVRVHLPRSSPFAKIIEEELRTYEIRVTQAGNLQFGAFEPNANDDIISALGYCCWYGVKYHVGGPRIYWL